MRSAAIAPATAKTCTASPSETTSDATVPTGTVSKYRFMQPTHASRVSLIAPSAGKSEALGADFDHIEASTSVVAGLVLAPSPTLPLTLPLPRKRGEG